MGAQMSAAQPSDDVSSATLPLPAEVTTLAPEAPSALMEAVAAPVEVPAPVELPAEVPAPVAEFSPPPVDIAPSFTVPPAVVEAPAAVAQSASSFVESADPVSPINDPQLLLSMLPVLGVAFTVFPAAVIIFSKLTENQPSPAPSPSPGFAQPSDPEVEGTVVPTSATNLATSAPDIITRGMSNLGKDPTGWLFGKPSPLYSNAKDEP